MSTPKHLKQPLPRQAGDKESSHMASLENLCPKPRFTLPSVAALHSDAFALGFSNAERQAAARALLRHNSHQDGSHYHTKTAGWRMITHEEFVEAALEDVFDALCMQDCLDGGISLLIRCPGSQARDSLTPEQIAVDVYVTPRELHEYPEQIGGDVSLFVQGFCEQIAKNHLQHFTERCRIEGIQPPHRCGSNGVSGLASSFGPDWLMHPMLRSSSTYSGSKNCPHVFTFFTIYDIV
ncbi:uncharacterized protein EDB91DRAFT_1251921 [Suillus paluster]|uniref:uncharacterized protein n=1 Tax=Suillus paluster TaxID=48578 RepID=UPI001B86B248|nr:uncharacterized protein EDB91DRAFT_1251921 [Suillus paluster]KAG1731983.1 hypothetical protein EDB91DRAFT_1251921 [Suillus paluster]